MCLRSSYKSFLIFWILVIGNWIFVKPANAGLTISPSYQYLTITKDKPLTAVIDFINTDSNPVSLNFSLSHIQATDLLGRLTFNAPLSQIINDASNSATISPSILNLQPNQSATISVNFDPSQITPNSSAYLLIASPTNTSLASTSANLTATSNFQSLVSTTIIIRNPITTKPDLKVLDFDWPKLPIFFSLPDFFRLTIKNSGTAPAVPRGIIQISTSPFLFTKNWKLEIGNRKLISPTAVITSGPLNEDSTIILPGSQRLIYSHLISSSSLFRFPFSLMTLTISAHDELHQTETVITKSFLYLNPIFIFGSIGVIIFTICIFYLRKNRISHIFKK